MTYDQILRRTPTAAGDLPAAKGFVEHLSLTIADRSTFETFTDSQQRYLYRLRSRWQARADGHDTRWNTSGSRPGRPVGSKSRAPADTHTDEHDPLFQSLSRKFGRPQDSDE